MKKQRILPLFIGVLVTLSLLGAGTPMMANASVTLASTKTAELATSRNWLWGHTVWKYSITVHYVRISPYVSYITRVAGSAQCFQYGISPPGGKLTINYQYGTGYLYLNTPVTYYGEIYVTPTSGTGYIIDNGDLYTNWVEWMFDWSVDSTQDFSGSVHIGFSASNGQWYNC